MGGEGVGDGEVEEEERRERTSASERKTSKRRRRRRGRLREDRQRVREVGHVERVGWMEEARGRGRWLEEGAARSRLRPHEREATVEADAAMRPRRGVESEHHLVNSRLLFPSASAPIGLRDHGGRSSSSSYFIRAYIRSASSDALGFSPCT